MNNEIPMILTSRSETSSLVRQSIQCLASRSEASGVIYASALVDCTGASKSMVQGALKGLEGAGFTERASDIEAGLLNSKKKLYRLTPAGEEVLPPKRNKHCSLSTEAGGSPRPQIIGEPTALQTFIFDCSRCTFARKKQAADSQSLPGVTKNELEACPRSEGRRITNTDMYTLVGKGYFATVPGTGRGGKTDEMRFLPGTRLGEPETFERNPDCENPKPARGLPEWYKNLTKGQQAAARCAVCSTLRSENEANPISPSSVVLCGYAGMPSARIALYSLYMSHGLASRTPGNAGEPTYTLNRDSAQELAEALGLNFRRQMDTCRLAQDTTDIAGGSRTIIPPSGET